MRSGNSHAIRCDLRAWRSRSRQSESSVDYVRANQSGTLRYEVWQEKHEPTRFVHLFVFRDAEADRIHSESPEVKELAGVLYPECLAPVEFIDYEQVASSVEPRL